MAIKLNRKYKPLWTTDCPIIVVTGGRGSGKSFAVGDFIENLTFEEGHTILFTRFTMSAAHISVIPEFEEKIYLENHADHFAINKTDIQNKRTGSYIIFRGLKTSSGNQTAALKSIRGLTTWVLDEAEELMEEKTFDKIADSIRQKGMRNRIILVLNPSNKTHWIYKRFFEDRGVRPDFNGEKEGICYIFTTYMDNVENLSDEFLSRVEWDKIHRPDRYMYQYLGYWRDALEGVIFSNWSLGNFDNALPFGFGLDFGFNDPDAMVKVAIDGRTRKIYVDECIYHHGLSPGQLSDKISKVAHMRDLIVADCAEARMVYELSKKFNIKKAVKGSGSIIEGIKLIQDYELVVTETSVNLIKELNNYIWLDSKSNTPIDDWCHLIDALRYYVLFMLWKGLRSPVMTRKN
jgi:phage terminase large subunit